MNNSDALGSSARHTCALIFCVLALLFGGYASASARTYTAIVIDADTGAILHASRPDLRNKPASLTKMMTLYMVFEALRDKRLRLDQKLVVSKRAAGQTPSKLFLKARSRISVEDAILSVVTKSANDSATVLAEALAETEVAFALLMTNKARKLGMYRTSFRNATGLPNRRQYTTARDMAILAMALQTDFPQYFGYFSADNFRWGKRRYGNHNTLLGSYEGVNGIKTGYTRASGFNLTASADRDGRRIIAVVMGGRTAKTRDVQMRRLLDRAFGSRRMTATMAMTAKSVQPGPPRAKPTSSGMPTTVATTLGDDIPTSIGELIASLSRRTTQPTTKPAVTPPTATAAAIPTAKPTPGGLRALPRNKRWGVQVGTFRAPESARKRAAQAAMVAPTYLKPAIVWIEPLPRPNRTLYRAKLVGLSERTARSTCRILVKKSFRCAPVQPSQSMAALSR